MSPEGSIRLALAFTASAIVHTALLWQARSPEASLAPHLPKPVAMTWRIEQPIVSQTVNTSNTADRPSHEPAPDKKTTAPSIPSLKKPDNKRGTVQPPGFVIPPDFSILETVEQIFPARLTLRIHVAPAGTLKHVEVLERHFANRDFVELAIRQIAATPLKPAIAAGNPIAGSFDLTIGTQPEAVFPETVRPALPAEGN